MRVRRLGAAACLCALGLAPLPAPVAVAQETPAQARQRVAQAAADLEDSTGEVRAAGVALGEVAAQLPGAQR
ncbi:MAG: hypothetical protein M3P93_02905, partial [Actinomycetota bacterium]|nr:hypothetical protein [Actinomycetota bacterium]